MVSAGSRGGNRKRGSWCVFLKDGKKLKATSPKGNFYNNYKAEAEAMTLTVKIERTLGQHTTTCSFPDRMQIPESGRGEGRAGRHTGWL